MIQTAQDTGSTLKVTLTDGTVLWVPKDPRNSDYIRVQQWLAAGGALT